MSDSLLKELKKRGFLQYSFSEVADEQLGRIMERVNENFGIWNAVHRVFLDRSKIDSLVKMSVGFTYENVSYLYAYYAVWTFLETTEVIKNLFLRAIRKRGQFKAKMAFGKFLNALKTCCPDSGPPFSEEIDIELRNALAHGTFWWSGEGANKCLNYVKTLGEEPASRKFLDVIDQMRKHNLFARCLSEVLREKVRSGFFEP